MTNPLIISYNFKFLNMKTQNILETIGNTPHIRINNLFNKNIEVWIKSEISNPGSSIKDRIAFNMVNEAEKRGDLKPGSVIIEPTSGNTGIGLAMVSSVKGYELILVMPESMSIERRKLFSVYGAKFELTPKELGMQGAVKRAQELNNAVENSWMPNQFANFDNAEIHRKTTALEIITDFPEGFDYMVAGIGSGGHITGVGEVLKKKYPNIKIIAVEPKDSAVISGSYPGPHRIQGIGAGFIPGNLNRDIIDDIITVSSSDAFKFTKLIAEKEGIFSGISTGASLAVIEKITKKITEKKRVLTFGYDTGERYLSLEDLF